MAERPRELIREYVDGLTDMEREALVACARMPYISVKDFAKIYGRHVVSATRAMERLRDLGLVKFHWRRSDRGISQLRWFVSDDGIRAIAYIANVGIDDILSGLPVSLQWQRRILSRIDAADTFYSLIADVSKIVGRACQWHWRGRGWIAGDLHLGEGQIMQIARVGPVVSRRAAQSRLGSMLLDAEKGLIYGVVFIAADYVQMRLMERWIRNKTRNVSVWVVRERDVIENIEGRIWSRPARLGLQYHFADWVFKDVDVSSERSSVWALAGYDYKEVDMPRGSSGLGLEAFAELSSSGRLALNAMADWPLATKGQLRRFAGISDRQQRRAVEELVKGGWVGRLSDYGDGRLGVTDEGLRRLAERDQTQIKRLRDLWGIERRENDGNVGYVPVGGSILKLEGELAHTEGCYAMLARLVDDCAGEDNVELKELLPAHRSERWLPSNRRGGLSGVRPDSSATIAIEGKDVPVMVEYERRADKPSLFEDKLSKYLRYYSMALKMEDWQRDVLALFVFADDSAAARFRGYCEEVVGQRRMVNSKLPLFISSSDEIREASWLDGIWTRAGGLAEGRLYFWK